METKKQIKILLVDDRMDNLHSLEVIFQGENYTCVKANSGKETLEILNQDSDFAIILIDVQMPDMDGFETVELIRHSPSLKYIPVIFLTASMENPNSIYKGYQAGAVDYMIKPLSADILKAKVSVFVEIYTKNQELAEYKKRINEMNIDIEANNLVSQYSRSLIEASLDPLVTICIEGRITDVNEASILVTGYSREDLLHTNFSNYFTEPEKAEKGYQLVFENGVVKDYPLTIKHKNGKLTDVLYNASLYKDTQNNIIGVFAAARDVTENNKIKSNLELTLKENIGYKYALDQACIVAFTDLDGKITYANDNFCKISQYSNAELIGQDHRIVNSGYHSHEFMGNIWNTIQNGDIWRGEIKNINKQGEFYWVDTTILPFKNEKGEVYQYVAVRTDITAKKILSQYALSLIEASLDPLVTINIEGKITDMNEATVNITGVERKKLLETDFLNYFTEPDLAREVYKEVFEKGHVRDYPLTLRHQNGKLTDVLFNGSIYKDDLGNVLGVVIVARDVTAQKVASKYARSLIEASIDPFVIINLKGEITDVNQAMSKITSKTIEQLKGTNFNKYFTDPNKAQDICQEVFEKGIVINYPLVISDHVLTDVLFNGSVFKDELGNIIGAVVVARDVTELKRIEKELIEAKVLAEMSLEIAEVAKQNAENSTLLAENALKSKQQFLSNMSHEIRTPMNAIIGFTKVVLKTDLTEKQIEYLNAIKLSGDSLIVLINDILDLAKVDSGKMTFEQTPFKLKSSIDAMLHLFEPKIQEKNLELIKEYDNNIPEVLVGDPVRLHQIILNLVSNAVKFTNHGYIKITVKLIEKNPEKAIIEFSVTDTGIGIATQKIDTIFENFQQASSGTSRLYGGTGLGLAIVKQLVESQGGSIKVSSVLEQGSTFSFTLSFYKTKSSAELDNHILELDKEIKSIKVLVVEDIALNQLLMKTLLDDFGFERDIAANGKIAIEKMEVNTYDVVLMDLQMPIMNGFEATEYIRNVLKSKIPIIALTADVTTVDLDKCKAVGMNDYIAKPVDERILYNKIVGLVKKIEVMNEIVEKNEIEEKSKYINLEYLSKRTKSNPTLMMEMITLYLEQTPPLIAEMKNSYQNKDWEMLQSAVHKMIPSFSIMGISTDFENMAKKVQEFASSQQELETINEMLETIEKVCTQACIELENEFNKIKKQNS